MTDKEKIRAEIERRRANYFGNATTFTTAQKMVLTELLSFIDSMQEEPKTDWLQELQNKLDSLSKEDFEKVWGKYGAEEKEEPVSEELEKAAKHYLYSNILYDDVYVGNPTDKDCIEMFKAGAQWQKQQDMQKFHNSETATFTREEFDEEIEKVRKEARQQIMKDAVEGEIVKDIANNLYIGKAQVNKNNFKFGEKVRLLVLKED